MALAWRCTAQADLDLIASLCSETLGVGKNDVVAVLSGILRWISSVFHVCTCAGETCVVSSDSADVPASQKYCSSL